MIKLKNFFSEMLKCKQKIYDRRNRLSADVYTKVQKFVEEGSYSSCKKAPTIAKMTLSGFDAKTIAQHIGKSYDTIRTEKRQISNDLWRIFPEDFFEKLADYSENRSYIDDCIQSLGTYNLSSVDYLIVGVLNDLKSQKDATGLSDCDILDLTNELDFLRRYSKAFFEDDLKTVDVKKVNYIIDVIDGKKGNSFIRSRIIKELTGGEVK